MKSSASSSRIVVTGAAGFIGAYLTRRLLAAGTPAERLILVDELPLFGERRACRDFARIGATFQAPGEFLEFIESAAAKDVATVFHIGACSNTDEFREDYLKTVNLDYSKRVWAACTRARVPLFYASSAATYGDGHQGFSDDADLRKSLKPLNPYGWSKQHFDLFVQTEAAAGRTPPQWAGFKFFNVYGPGEDHKGGQASVLWHARRQFLQNGSVNLFRSHRSDVADGEQKRDFVWVGDVVDVLTTFAREPLKSEIYNVGCGQARTFIDLAKAVAASVNVEPRINFVDTPEKLRKGYQYWTQADLKNLRRAGYTQPFTSLEDGARLYVKEWSLDG